MLFRSPFINNCKNAFKQVTDAQKENLLNYIISQLRGRAEAACSIKEFNDFQQLEDFLVSQFGERKHYATLITDLLDCRQTYGETVSQFGQKIEICLSELLTEIHMSTPAGKHIETIGRYAAMKDLAIHTFMKGLNPKLSIIVRCRNPETLNEAINLASSEEKFIQSIDNTPSPSYKPNYSQNVKREFQPRPNLPPGDNSTLCRYCKLPGHTLEKCYRRDYNNKKYRGSFQPSGQKPYVQDSNYKPRFPIHNIEPTGPPQSHDNPPYLQDNEHNPINPHLNE